jgi:hypothetical protein
VKIKKTKTQGNTVVGTSFGKLSASLKGRMPVDSIHKPLFQAAIDQELQRDYVSKVRH